MHIFCSICQELFAPSSQVYVVKCGHMYHEHCINEWMKQKAMCPQCRAPIITKLWRVYFSVENDVKTDAVSLQHKIDSLMYKIQVKEKEIKDDRKLRLDTEEVNKRLKDHAKTLERELQQSKESILCFKEQIRHYLTEIENIKSVKADHEFMKSRVTTLENIEKLIKGTVQSVNSMLEHTERSPQSFRNLCTYITVLKEQLAKAERKSEKNVSENNKLNKEVSFLQKKEKQLKERIDFLDLVNKENETEVLKLEKLKTCLECRIKELEEAIWKKRVLQPTSSTNVEVKKQKLDESVIIEEPIIIKDNSKSKPSLKVSEAKPKFIDLNFSKPAKVASSNSITVTTYSVLQKSKHSIFNKKPPSCLAALNSSVASTSKSFTFDGMGGSSKIPYQATPREELVEARKKLQKEKKVSKPPKNTTNLDKYFKS